MPRIRGLSGTMPLLPESPEPEVIQARREIGAEVFRELAGETVTTLLCDATIAELFRELAKRFEEGDGKR